MTVTLPASAPDSLTGTVTSSPTLTATSVAVESETLAVTFCVLAAAATAFPLNDLTLSPGISSVSEEPSRRDDLAYLSV